MNAQELSGSEQNILEYSFGSMYGPNAPLGEYKLIILRSDKPNAKLEHHVWDTTKKWTAVIDEDTKMKLWEALKTAGFPAYNNPASIVPDSTMRNLTVDHPSINIGKGKATVSIPWHEAKDLPGYKEVFEILDSIIYQMSGSDTSGATNTLQEKAVSEVKQQQ